MSSTNKTANYNLSQYIGSDKPTYLSDYNSDMYNIDAQMKTNADNVSTALTGVTTATNTANSANATATSASNTANTALSTATTTATALNTFQNKFNLNSRISYGQDDVTITGITFSSIEAIDVTVAKDSTGSIFKFYGNISGVTSGQGSAEIEFANTGLLVDEPYNIGPVAMVSNATGNPDRFAYITVSNNKITLKWWNESAGALKVTIFPCVYFNADFGDTPSQQ